VVMSTKIVAVLTAAAHGVLVNAEMLNGAGLRDGQCADQTERGVHASSDGHPPGQTGSRTTAQEQSDVRELGGESVRAARVPPGQGRDLLGERPVGTTVAPAHEATCLQIESYVSAGDRTVRQTPLVITVHLLRMSARTPDRRPKRPGPHDKTDLSVPRCYLLDLHPDIRRRMSATLPASITPR
jgi:hypothetical protein